jgi:hypothetical protein
MERVFSFPTSLLRDQLDRGQGATQSQSVSQDALAGGVEVAEVLNAKHDKSKNEQNQFVMISEAKKRSSLNL